MTTHVNPDRNSLNTKPVTAAKAKALKGSTKLNQAVDKPAPVPAQVSATGRVIRQPAAPKAVPVNVMTGLYPGLDQWPVDTAGPAPNDYDLARAYCFTHATIGRPSKRVLAAAAYLRPCARDYAVPAVSNAVWAAMGGDVSGGVLRNDLRNVMTDMVTAGYCTKTPYRIGTMLSYEAAATPRGEQRWATFIALHPQFNVLNPYNEAVKRAAEKQAKLDAAKAKRAATHEANKGGKVTKKAKHKAGNTVEHTMPHSEATKAADTSNPVEGVEVPATTENSQVTA